MFKTLTPIIAILIAVGLYFTYIQPTFTEVRALQDESEDYAQAIERAGALRARISELVARQNSFSSTDLERLEALLPDQFDEVALMLDIDALARRHRMDFGDIQVLDNKELEREIAVAREDTADLDPDEARSQPADTSVSFTPNEISFSVTGTYENFRSFLRDLERSLLLLDVTHLEFMASEGDLTKYVVTVRTYSFNVAP